MDFFIETVELQKAVKALSITAKLNTSEPSGLILIKADNNGSISFLSNNGSIVLSFTSYNAVVKTSGTTLIEYGKIKSFSSSLTPWNGEYGVKGFHFVLEDRTLKISLSNIHNNNHESKGELKLKNQNHELFLIHLPKPFEKPNFILNSTIFKNATNKILYALDPSHQNYALQNMKVLFDEDNICFVSTNGKTLSEYKVKNISELKKGEFLFKYDFIMAIRRAITEETKLAFELTDRDVKVVFNNICLWGQNVIGYNFPEYNNLFEKTTHSFIIDKIILMETILPFSDVLNQDDDNRLTLRINNNKVLLSNEFASFEYLGDNNFEGDFIIDVNGKSFLQTIEAIKDDKILLKFSNQDSPLIFDSANFLGQTALIAPIRRRG